MSLDPKQRAAREWDAPDSIQPLRHDDERNDSAPYRLVSLADLGPAEEPDWLVRGYLACGTITLLTALPKAGKTTFASHLLRDLYRGSGLTDVKLDAPTIYLSEEPTALWCGRREALSLSPSIHLVQRESFGKPRLDEWLRTLDALRRDVIRLDARLVVVDTLATFWPVVNENDAGEVMTALPPLRGLSEAGAAVLLIHHPRKGDGEQGTAARGSGALTGFPDVLLELRRHDSRSMTDRRRVVKAYGRFDCIPAEQVFELGEGGYTLLGERADVRQTDDVEAVLDLLPDSGEGLTFEQVKAAWPTDPKPGNTRLRGLLNDGADEGRWLRLGTGVKNDAHRYVRSAAPDSFQPADTPRGRNESESADGWGRVPE